MICVRNRGLLSLWLFHLGAKIESGWLSKVSTRSGLCKDCFLLKKLCAVPNNEFDNLEWTSRAHRVNQPFAQLQSYVVFFESVFFQCERVCVCVQFIQWSVFMCVCMWNRVLLNLNSRRARAFLDQLRQLFLTSCCPSSFVHYPGTNAKI